MAKTFFLQISINLRLKSNKYVITGLLSAFADLERNWLSAKTHLSLEKPPPSPLLLPAEAPPLPPPQAMAQARTPRKAKQMFISLCLILLT
jgi:hypothetical protein